jgi:hypothetical protein
MTDNDSFRTELADARTSWEIRLRLAERGWQSDTRIKDKQFQIWFKRNTWHGQLATVTFFSGCQLNLKADAESHDHDVASMRLVVSSVAERAADAWISYPDSVPCQGPKDQLLVDEAATKRAFGTLVFGDHQSGRPTERMPFNFTALWEGVPDGPDWLLSRARSLAMIGALYTDDLSPLRWSSPNWVFDRTWGFEHAVAFPKWHEIRTDFRPIRMSTPTLSDDFIDDALENTLSSFKRYLGKYRPGSPHGALPPFLRASFVWRINQEIEIREQQVLATPDVQAEDPDALHVMAELWEERRTGDPVLAREICHVDIDHVIAVLVSLKDRGLLPDNSFQENPAGSSR